MAEQKIAVVTGASKGIGLAVANRLIEDGYRVYGLCRSEGKVKQIRWVECDVARADAVKQAFAEIFRREEGIDVLICNAGMGISGAAEFTPAEDLKRQMEVNFSGAVYCVQQVIPSMRSRRRGKIVFISSLGAIFPLPFQSFYSASKASVNTFSDALGIEVKPFGIQTCTVMLNDVKTEFTANRKKTAVGDELYSGRISASVEKMEKSEQKGMEAETVAALVGRLLRRRRLPPHKIAGISNEFLGLLQRILPTRTMLWLLGKIYG